MSSIDDAELMSHLYEPDPAQRLGQYISHLLVCSHMINIDHTITDALSYVVETGVNVLASFVMNWVFTEFND